MSAACPWKNAYRSLGAIVAGVVLFAASGAAAQDWPQWRGPNRDGKVTGFTAPQTWPKTLVQKWKVTVGSGDATPALVGDKLYVFTRQGDDEVTLCLNAADGKEMWSEKYAADAVTGPAARHPGPRSSPAVAEGKIVTLGVNGVFSCIDAASGKLVWRKDPFPKAVPRFFTSTSPIIVDGMAITQLGGDGKGAIIAYDVASGEEKWRCDAQCPEYASPVILTADGAKQLVTLTDKSVVGVGLADGKLLWQIAFVPKSRAYNAVTPIVSGETAIYTGAGRGTYAVKIEKQGDAFVAKELWGNPDTAPQFNSPVLHDGLLFGLSIRGNLFCLDAATGKTLWTDQASLDRGGFGEIVDAGSVLLALPSSGELIVYAPDGKQFTELARYKVCETATYAYPVVAGSRIFVKDQDAVTFWAVE
jgi:outer membrane protein assembly factor BamB